jgi:hypothetical protein
MGSGRVRRIGVTVVEVVAYVLLTVGATITAASGVSGAVNSWEAEHDGETGTFTPVEQDCSRHRVTTVICTWNGTWASDVDGRILRNVHLDDSLGSEEGDAPPGPVHPTLHSGRFADPQVVYLPGERTWLLALAASILIIGVQVFFAWRVHRWARAKRAPGIAE